MRVISNTLKPELDRWDDPGGHDGPRMPSYTYCCGVEGEAVVELSAEEAAEYKAAVAGSYVHDYLHEELPDSVNVPGIIVRKWGVEELPGDRLKLWAEDCDVSKYST